MSFLVSIVLARLLAPEDYGVIALVTVFTSILQVFVDSGLGTALVQKKNADEADFSSVFYFNVLVCLTLYAGMFVAAPAIAKFYDNPIYIPLVRVLSLTLVISGLKNIQQAYVYRHMIFKRFFFYIRRNHCVCDSWDCNGICRIRSVGACGSVCEQYSD